MLMQYLWQHKLQLRPGMTTTDGRAIEIIDPGRLNADSGPDFFNAKIKLDGETWVGNIELHIKASDWYRHRHDTDRAYDSVILHVVAVDDITVNISNGRVLPQLLLPCTPAAVESYARLQAGAPVELPCAAAIRAMSSLHLTDWLSSLAFERVNDKVDRLNDLSITLGGDWEEVAYVALARALGFSINSDPFERLARSLPLRYIRKHADNIDYVEAMLMGQSGLLATASPNNGYARQLARDYEFLTYKFQLQAPGLQWRMSRLRPANAPFRRIALLARILCSRTSLLSHILAVRTIDEARALFSRPLRGYWATHYTLDTTEPEEAGRFPTALSRASVVSLIINVVIPLIYARGLLTDSQELLTTAMELLEALPAEQNRLTAIFQAADLTPANALQSQAMIQLRRNYCETAKCLYCRFGHHKIKSLFKTL